MEGNYCQHFKTDYCYKCEKQKEAVSNSAFSGLLCEELDRLEALKKTGSESYESGFSDAVMNIRRFLKLNT